MIHSQMMSTISGVLSKSDVDDVGWEGEEGGGGRKVGTDIGIEFI